jgi:ribosomal-protein-alanine N-acetyltransferase
MAGWVAAENEDVAGFLVARQIAREIEILNFAVRRDARGKGVGAALLAAAFRWGKGLGAEQAFLEVRDSNLLALHFYERHGFSVTGRRPRYYAAPVEDALVLKAPLS